jgi:hypothetical protein
MRVNPAGYRAFSESLDSEAHTHVSRTAMSSRYEIVTNHETATGTCSRSCTPSGLYPMGVDRDLAEASTFESTCPCPSVPVPVHVHEARTRTRSDIDIDKIPTGEGLDPSPVACFLRATTSRRSAQAQYRYPPSP